MAFLRDAKFRSYYFVFFHFEVTDPLLCFDQNFKHVLISLKLMILSYRNQSTDLHRRLIDWFLNDWSFGLKKVDDNQ